jgi:hypothetical protein
MILVENEVKYGFGSTMTLLGRVPRSVRGSRIIMASEFIANLREKSNSQCFSHTQPNGTMFLVNFDLTLTPPGVGPILVWSMHRV